MTPHLAPYGSDGTATPGDTPETAVAVATVNQVLKEVVEGAFLPLWVRGEVSDFKRHRNGHWYFTLRDSTSQLRCVTWSRDQRSIPASPDDGMQVAVFGQLTVYAARGDVQMSVRRIEAEGDGLWLKALEATKKRLEADGLLAPERKRPLPPLPRTVAVITSPSGAALHDIIHVVRRRNAATNIVLIPAKVQGEGAAEELTDALHRFARWRGAEVLIIGRGGGAREDLWCFNDERLARALAECPVPTISAVGHEIDTTVCDLVADFRAATPSAAAEAAVPVVADMEVRVRGAANQLRRGIERELRSADQRLRRGAESSRERMRVRLSNAEQRIRHLAGRVNDLSPVATMARGFAIARSEEGRTLTRAGEFREGMPFRLRVRDGTVDARVTSVENLEIEVMDDI